MNDISGYNTETFSCIDTDLTMASRVYRIMTYAVTIEIIVNRNRDNRNILVKRYHCFAN